MLADLCTGSRGGCGVLYLLEVSGVWRRVLLSMLEAVTVKCVCYVLYAVKDVLYVVKGVRRVPKVPEVMCCVL